MSFLDKIKGFFDIDDDNNPILSTPSEVKFKYVDIPDSGYGYKSDTAPDCKNKGFGKVTCNSCAYFHPAAEGNWPGYTPVCYKYEVCPGNKGTTTTVYNCGSARNCEYYERTANNNYVDFVRTGYVKTMTAYPYDCSKEQAEKDAMSEIVADEELGSFERLLQQRLKKQQENK